jgi:hypothetical protein
MGQRLEGKKVAFLAADGVEQVERIPSRKPDGLKAFCEKAVEEICEGRHEEQARQAKAASAA